MNKLKTIGILALLLVPVVYGITGWGGTNELTARPSRININNIFTVKTTAYQTTSNGVLIARLWLEYDLDTTSDDDSEPSNQQITNECGDKAFRVISGPYKQWFNTTDRISQTFTWKVQSCGLSGRYDIGVDRDLLAGSFTALGYDTVTVRDRHYSLSSMLIWIMGLII